MYPGQKVGLIWDHARQHYSKEVQILIDKMTAEGRLVVMFIPKGLTSVMQVCDIVANKELKQSIKSAYYLWRMEQIKKHRQKNGDMIAEIKIKVPYEVMIKFVEDGVNKFNEKQINVKQTIKDTFQKMGQDPWYGGKDDKFIEHLDKLKDNAHFKRELEEAIDTNQMHTNLGDGELTRVHI